jgi:hypothetical protein
MSDLPAEIPPAPPGSIVRWTVMPTGPRFALFRRLFLASDTARSLFPRC